MKAPDVLSGRESQAAAGFVPVNDGEGALKAFRATGSPVCRMPKLALGEF